MKDTEQLIAIISNLQNGKDEAASELYDAYHDDVYYFILKTVNDPELAADLMQETFIEILQTIGNLKEPAAFPAWSRQIAYHKCTAHFRKRHELLVDENEDGQTVFDTLVEEREEFIPDEALEKQDLRQIIHRMISDLPEEQRAAIMMRYFDELSVKEIAQVQNVSEGTVKSRLNYGRQAIKQSVKDYEKKNGVKLHCAGVIPLLLWLLKMTGGLETTTNVTAVAGEGLKATGKLTAKKMIAGVAAAAVVTGGVTAGILLTQESELPMEWIGYGVSSLTNTRRFDLTVEEFDDAYISGHLEVSYLYEVVHDTDFTGVGSVEGSKVLYTLTFETPAVVGTIPTFEYAQMELEYDKITDCFSFDFVYEVDMERCDGESPRVLAKDQNWSGVGEDGFYNVLKKQGHLFEMDVYEMTNTEISGRFMVSYNGEYDHISEFAGRGYVQDNTIHYEILLETPRTEENIIKITEDRFWLSYNTETQIFEIPLSEMYSVEMEKN